MRILVCNQYFYPDTASTGQLLTELCIDLARNDEVTVVCGQPSYNAAGPTTAPEGIERVRIRRAWSTTFGRRSMAGRLVNYATFMLSAVWGTMRSPRPDVVVAMTDPPVVAVLALLAAAFRRVPFVFVNQDIFPDIAVALGRMREGPLQSTLTWLGGVLRGRAAVVVAIGEDMRQRLVDMGTPSAKIVVIPNWADGRVIRPGGGDEFRRTHGWTDRFVVMHSGNVGLSQALPTLVEAANVLRADEDLLIAIVGDGASRPILEEQVRSLGLTNVEFLPYQVKSQLSDSLGAADIHVVSMAKGLRGSIVPSKLYGIMAAGRPVLTAVEAGAEPARVVRSTGCGVVVPPEDPLALADAIRSLRSTDLEAMGRAGREAFEALYDRPAAVAAYRSVLERAVGAWHDGRPPAGLGSGSS